MGKIRRVTPFESGPRSRRMLISVLVALLGMTLGAGGIVLLHPFDRAPPPQAAAAVRHDGQGLPRPLSDAAIRARIEPSVVDVIASLTYDDETASGTGFIVGSAAGLVLTNNHVVRDATSVAVTVPATGRTYRARIVGVDVAADIAVLQIRPVTALPSAPIGDSAGVGAGVPVVSFGNRAGAGGAPAVARGVISGTGRTIQADDGASGFTETLRGMLATTARIEPGDSGGPLADSAGAVVGVDTAAGTGGTATGYAIPIDTAIAKERQIAAGHRGPGISLGVGGFLGAIVGSGTASSPAAQRAAGPGGGTGTMVRSVPSPCVTTRGGSAAPAAMAPARAGALVIGVLCGTGAATAGMAAGDVITAAGGRRVASPDALTTIVAGGRPGSTMSVTWVSTKGIARTTRVKLGAAPAL
jgi:S1-C subfamily serine protease